MTHQETLRIVHRIAANWRLPTWTEEQVIEYARCLLDLDYRLADGALSQLIRTRLYTDGPLLVGDLRQAVAAHLAAVRYGLSTGEDAYEELRARFERVPSWHALDSHPGLPPISPFLYEVATRVCDSHLAALLFEDGKRRFIAAYNARRAAYLRRAAGRDGCEPPPFELPAVPMIPTQALRTITKNGGDR